jgi:protein TonB
MTAIAIHATLPWTVSADDERRFRRIVKSHLLIIIALGLIMPFLPLPEINKQVQPELPPPVARLMLENKPVPPPQPVVLKPEPKPKPKPLPKKVEQPKPAAEVKTKPQPRPDKQAKVIKREPVKPKPSARELAQQSGLLAMTDTLADLRQNTVASSLTKTRNLSQTGGSARKTERAILTTGTTSTSGGIQTASLSRNTGGGQLTGRSTTQVHSPTGNAPAPASVGGKGRGERTAGRSIEDIQIVFDRNKGAIYSVYNRALRKDPTLQGKLILQLTIAPSGQVTACSVVSSELHDTALGEKISARVKLFDFGASDVEAVTITYPIDFLPA